MGRKKQARKPQQLKKPLGIKPWYANRPHLLGIVALLLISFLLFSPALDNEFTNFDDQLYVTDNPIIYGLDGTHLGQIITEPVAGNYHPVTMFTLAINYRMSGMDAVSYIWTNILLHLLNTFLVFLFLYRLFQKNFLIGIIGAALFAVHPMHVESVAWVSERKDVLYTAFFLGGLTVYLQYLKNKSRGNLGLVFLLFGLSVFSKPAAVVFPLILLLLDYYKKRNPLAAKAIAEKIPFFVLSVIVGLLTISAQKGEAIGTFDNYSFLERALFACYGWMIYLVKLFVPFQLSAMHPYPDMDNGLPAIFYLSPVVIIGLFAWAILYRKKSLVPLFGLLFYSINLLLVLQLVSVGRAIIAERYTYVPYLGIFIIIGWAFMELKKARGAKWKVPLAATTLAIWALVLGYLTFERVEVWEDSQTLWADAAEKYPDDWYPYLGLGNYHKERLEYEEALAYFDMALMRKPDKASLYDSRGNMYRRLQRHEEAMADYNKALSMDPGDAAFYSDRGSLYFDLGQDEKALQDFQKALQLKPDLYQAYSNIGSVYGRQQRFDLALQNFTKALEINPTYPDAMLYRGMVYGMQQHWQPALTDLTHYLGYAANADAKGYYWRAKAFAGLGQNNEALRDYHQAIGLAPGNGDYFLGRSEVYAAMGQKQEALQDALQARQLGAQVSDAFMAGLRQ